MKKYLPLLFLLSSPGWSAAPIAFVQAKSCHDTPTSGVTSATCLYDSRVIAGNAQVVVCMGNSLTANFRVTTDQGDSFTIVNGTHSTTAPSGGTLVWATYYSTNAVGDFTTVTCQDIYANTGWTQMSIHEYSGFASAFDPFDVFSASSSATLVSTTTYRSGTVTTSKNGELCFSVAPQMTSAALAGNGTIRTSDLDNSRWATQDAIIPLGGTVYESSFTVTAASLVNKMSQACFKPNNPAPRGVQTWE